MVYNIQHTTDRLTSPNYPGCVTPPPKPSVPGFRIHHFVFAAWMRIWDFFFQHWQPENNRKLPKKKKFHLSQTPQHFLFPASFNHETHGRFHIQIFSFSFILSTCMSDMHASKHAILRVGSDLLFQETKGAGG